MIPIATTKSPSLFLLIVEPPFRVAGKLGKAIPLAQEAALCYHIPKPISWAIQE